MRHEKIVLRKDGTQYQICVNAYLDSYRNEEYRRLSMDERREYDNNNNLRFVKKEEIYDAKIELWNLLKPQM